MQQRKQLVRSNGGRTGIHPSCTGTPGTRLETLDSIRIQKFQHEPHNLGREAQLHPNDAFAAFPEGGDALSHGIFSGGLSEEGLEVIGSSSEEGFVGADFYEGGIVEGRC